MSLLGDIPQGAVVGLDTSPFIYLFEAHPSYGPVVRPFFESRLYGGLNRGVTSTMSLAEVLVQPLRSGRADLVAGYRALLTATAHMTLLGVTELIAERAAGLRARYSLKLPDACQIAAALEAKAAVFVTNDAPLRRVTDLRVLVLSDYLPPAPAPPVTAPVP